MWSYSAPPGEGDLYKALNVEGHRFELRYGYYEEEERQFCPPVVLYPDLSAAPHYSMDGYPLVTCVQDPCEHCRALDGQEVHWCSDCIHYSREYEEISICRCEHRKSNQPEGGN